MNKIVTEPLENVDRLRFALAITGNIELLLAVSRPVVPIVSPVCSMCKFYAYGGKFEEGWCTQRKEMSFGSRGEISAYLPRGAESAACSLYACGIPF